MEQFRAISLLNLFYSNHNCFMRYYSTNKNTPEVSLKEAVVKGLAADSGLFMPERINKFEPSFFENIQNLTFQEIGFEVAKKL